MNAHWRDFVTFLTVSMYVYISLFDIDVRYVSNINPTLLEQN